MPAVVVAVLVFTAFYLGFRLYSRYLAEKVYRLDPNFVTPAHELKDGVDYVPTNKHVLFGHHFTSVAGAAPIVGPAIAVYWGWLPAMLWVVFGAIFAAGVHDTGALVTSVRNKGQNIGTLSGSVISSRARSLFLIILFFLLTLVNAVFAAVMATLFIANPAAVIPAVAVIPIAIAVGQRVYRSRSPALISSLIGLVVLYIMIPVGQLYPVSVDDLAALAGLSPKTTWILLIFLYTWFASRLPVWMLLQPRDYINSHQLFVALGLIFCGVLAGFDTINAPAVNTHTAADSPSWFPFLFITIACGAISGFHSLVASGTTSKQLDKETDARYVGYLGALGEGSLALGAILATTAGIGTAAVWNEKYVDFGTASSGAVGNFVGGVGHFVSHLGIPPELGAIFASVVVITFAGTTMDTGVRLQRYIFQEVGELIGARWLARNVTLATTAGVAAPLALALAPGGGEQGFAFGRLWQLFGTTNQLTAGLTLAVVAVWTAARRCNPVAPLIPLVFLLFMTVYALFLNLVTFYTQRDWLLLSLDSIILVLSVWLLVEAIVAFNRLRRASRAQAVPVER